MSGDSAFTYTWVLFMEVSEEWFSEGCYNYDESFQEQTIVCL